MSNGQWTFSTALPARYSNYDLYGGYKIVMNGPRPYVYFKEHKNKYAKYRGVYNRQPVIRNSSNGKYFVKSNSPGQKNSAPGKSKKNNGKSKGKK